MLRVAYQPNVGFDLVLGAQGLESDDGIETAVILSLFTDAPATDDELAIAGLTREQNRGWFGNDYPDVDGDVWGSKLWLLQRAKRSDETLARANGYAREAVAWLITDGVASRIPIEAAWYGRTGFLVLYAQGYRPGDLKPRWRRVWNATTGAVLEAS